MEVTARADSTSWLIRTIDLTQQCLCCTTAVVIFVLSFLPPHSKVTPVVTVTCAYAKLMDEAMARLYVIYEK